MSANKNRESEGPQKVAGSSVAATTETEATAAARATTLAPPKHQKSTPLPMNQMVPMTFVLLNESICGTMLLPFVGLLVAHLKGTPVEEAGYESGMLIGMFMLGQMVSSRMWGWISDKYGRRFPIISGLFTSGLMMLGFGLSTSVWMCAVFRFFHGLFNGNVLVAKTMMADITDKTNQAKGFAFVSLSYGIGTLIGPTLGGLLYDPAISSALQWAHISKDSFFSTHPALLPSLVIFIYTNIGMTICTFFVKESNPQAQPLPSFVKFLYPCMLRRAEPFAHPRHTLEETKAETVKDDEKRDGSHGLVPVMAAPSNQRSSSAISEDSQDRILGMSVNTARDAVANVTMTRAVASLMVASPVRQEDRRYDHFGPSESLAVATPQHSVQVPGRYGSPRLPTLLEAAASGSHAGSGVSERSADEAGIPPTVRKTVDGVERPTKATTTADADYNPTVTDNLEDGLVAVEGEGKDTSTAQGTPEGVASATLNVTPEEAAVVKRFGYKQAFQRPITRSMLILYMLLSAADMAVQEILPLWAIASVSAGGLGFDADMVGYIILTNSVPCVTANLLFHKACSRYENKLSLFRLAIMSCGTAICVLPFMSYLNLGRMVFPAVVLCTSIRQFFASWCYGLVTMLTACSAPPGHVGSIMGINQSCGALVRTLVPFAVTPLFAWSITSDHVFPFDHVFVFFLSGITFALGSLYSVWLRTNGDSRLELVDRNPAWMQKVKSLVCSLYDKLQGTSHPAQEVTVTH